MDFVGGGGVGRSSARGGGGGGARANSHASADEAASTSYSQEFENSFAKASSLASSRPWWTSAMFTGCVLASLGTKIWSLVVFFSRMRVQVLLLTHPRDGGGGGGEQEQHVVTHTLLNDFLIDFSFPEMVRDFWHARAFFVAVVIVTGTAIVPLSRHAFFVWAWFVPTHARSMWATLRTRGLIFFDYVGRTSLVDLFLLGYVICIFYTQVDEFIVSDRLGVRVQINGEPVRGIFMGIATSMSGMFINQYMLLVDEEHLMGRVERRVTVGAGPAVASLSQRLWASPETGCFKLMATCVLGSLVAACGAIMFILFFGDPLVAFHMEGLAGVVAKEEWREFYLLTAPLDIPSRTTNHAGGQFLSVVYLAVVVIVPVALLLATTVLWLVPLDLRQQRTALTLYPFWFSWCAVDVLFITTLAAYLEMHLIAEFTFDNKFKELCSAVKTVMGMSCSSLGRRFESGLPLLGTVSLLFALLHLVFLKLAARLLESEPAAVTVWPIDSPFAEHFMSSASASPRLALESPIVLAGPRIVSSASSSANNNNLTPSWGMIAISSPQPPSQQQQQPVKDSNSSSGSTPSAALLNENVHSRRVI